MQSDTGAASRTGRTGGVGVEAAGYTQMGRGLREGRFGDAVEFVAGGEEAWMVRLAWTPTAIAREAGRLESRIARRMRTRGRRSARSRWMAVGLP